jgi:uncharacterized membrane protein
METGPPPVDDVAMPVDVEVEAIIERPPEVVAAFAGDPTNAPTWYANIKSVHWQTPPPVGIGSKLDFIALFLGKRLAYTYEVVELEPGQRLVMRTTDGPFPMETTYTWARAGEIATQMTLRNRGIPSGFFRVAAPLMERAVRRATTKDLKRLKTLLEEPTPSDAAASARSTCGGCGC